MKKASNSCDTCRARRVKCDGVRPVCGRCEKSNRQCRGPGFSDEVRLILKDETATVIKRFKRKSRESSDGEGTRAERSSSSSEGSAPPEGSAPSLVNNIISGDNNISECNDNYPAEWYPLIPKVQVSPVYERDQVALFCCRETVNFKTLSWVMSDDKWIGVLPEMMGRSEALTSVIHANAANYLARATGANSTPRQALTHYSYALKELQRDLYNPARQTSDETLFAIILLGLHNNHNLGSWQSHVQGATRLIQCKGSEYYKSQDSPSRVLAKYVRGFDIIRAMTSQEETVFGAPEWNHLGEGQFVRPLDSLLTHYGHITNIIAQSEKLESPSVENMDAFLAELKAVRKSLGDWKKALPIYYDAIPVPIPTSETDANSEDTAKYPYDQRLDYMTSFIGHTMNLYKAAILRIDRHLLDRWHPLSNPSEPEKILAREIVMSLPTLSNAGGIFLLYPVMRAAKVLDREEKLYIVSVLLKISAEVPVAAPLAGHVLEFEHEAPTYEQCRVPLAKVWGEGWDTKGNFIGNSMGGS